jgi:hypothetical protein
MKSPSRSSTAFEEDSLVREHSSAPASADVSLLQLVNAVLRRPWFVLGCSILAAVLTAAFILTRERTYTAAGSFVPQGGSQSSGGLSGLAQQFGLSVASTDGPSPQLYAALMQTPTILSALGDSAYDHLGSRKTLAELFEIHDSSAYVVRTLVGQQLGTITSAVVDRDNGLVKFSVTTPWPDVSLQIAQRWLDEVNDFGVRARRQRAAAEREFISERSTLARQQLEQAESRLQVFLQRNRQYGNDPQLVVEHDRLMRDLDILGRLYVSLVQGLEQAALESARNTARIQTVDAPQLPVFPDARRLVLRSAVAFLAGFALAIFIVLSREYISSRSERESAEWGAFRSLLRNLRSDLRHPLRAIREHRGS